MIVQDFLRKVDIDKQVELICNNQADYEKPYDKKYVKEVQTQFINTLLSLTPEYEDNIIIFEKYWADWNDIPEEYIASELYEKKELINYLNKNKNKNCPVDNFNENDRNENLEKLLKQFDKMPQSYAFEFTEWEKILGWEICEDNLEEFDIQECIYAILSEMSFNGITRESQEERREKLEESVKQHEEIMKLPEEERDKHYISLEEIEQKWKENFGWEPPTQEERYESQRLMWVCSLKTMIWKFNNFKKISEKYDN